MLKKFSYFLMLVVFTASAASDGRKANKAYNEGNYEEAEKLYQAAIEQEPENARLYFNLGNAQAKLDKVEKAIQSYLEFRNLADAPEDKAMAEYNIGTLLAEKQNWKPAATHFRSSLTLNPADFDAKHNYERVLQELQNEENNEDQQQEQENQPPPEPSAYAIAMKNQAEKLVEQRRYQEAYELMQQALQADETVRAFNDFINRTKNVSEIDAN